MEGCWFWPALPLLPFAALFPERAAAVGAVAEADAPDAEEAFPAVLLAFAVAAAADLLPGVAAGVLLIECE